MNEYVRIGYIFASSDIEKNLLLFKDSLYNKNINVPMLAQKYSKFGKVLLLYKNDSELPVGFVSLYANNIKEKECFISIICIRKEYQHSGYGTILLNEVFKIAKKCGLSRIQLEVDKQNVSATKFYSKKGFSIHKELQNSYLMYKSI